MGWPGPIVPSRGSLMPDVGHPHGGALSNCCPGGWSWAPVYPYKT